MNNQFIKDLSKGMSSSNLGGSKELSPGSTPRRYEPASGIKKHNERIHNESRQLDNHGNLPFSFSKPKKNKRTKTAICSNCSSIKYVNINTVGVICKDCGTYAKVVDIDMEESNG